MFLFRCAHHYNARTRGGGVLIAVRKGIPYSTKNAPLTSIETAAIQIAGTGLTIVGAYNPPHNYFKISELPTDQSPQRHV
jgi:hypothetical protein